MSPASLREHVLSKGSFGGPTNTLHSSRWALEDTWKRRRRRQGSASWKAICNSRRKKPERFVQGTAARRRTPLRIRLRARLSASS